ncbi:MAG: Zn-dependent protease [Porticoccaceae bacterium]|nr:MAG: Zn-dependent protease [Porticoccaceae bacterium]
MAGSAGQLDPRRWRRHAWLNWLQSVLLLASMGAVVGLLGHWLWGPDGLVVFLSLALGGLLLGHGLSPRLALALYGARPLRAEEAPGLYALVEELSRRAGLERIPTLWWVPSPLLNAFAVGTRRDAAIGLTDGLLRNLDARELAGVLAHEVSHIRADDLWVMGLADLMSRTAHLLSLLGQLLLLFNLPLWATAGVHLPWGALLLLVAAPLVVTAAQLALSRTREFDADLNAAALTGDPEGLASALARLETLQGGWLERLFWGRGLPQPSWLRTHPPTEERIARLLALSQEAEGALAVAAPLVTRLPEPVVRRPRLRLTGLWY